MHQESTTNKLTLEEDDPNAIKGLIASFQGLHFDGRNAYAKYEMKLDGNANGIAYVKYLVDLYAVPGKYLALSLQEFVEWRFNRNLAHLYYHDGSLTGIGLGEIARHVFLVHPVAAAKFREPLIDDIHLDIFICDEEKEARLATLKELLLDVPELSFELMTKVCHVQAKGYLLEGQSEKL